MKFDELKFSGEEVSEAQVKAGILLTEEVRHYDAVAIVLNRILAEKLARAPLVYGKFPGFTWETIQTGLATRKGRLVCIEEVGK